MICSEFFVLKAIVSHKGSRRYIVFDHSEESGTICFGGNIIKTLDPPPSATKEDICGKVIFVPLEDCMNLYFVSSRNYIFPLSTDVYSCDTIQDIIDSPILAAKVPTLKLLLKILNL